VLLEHVFSPLSSCTHHLSRVLQIGTLAKAMAVAGKLGSENLPASAGATKVELKDGTSYTVIGNAGALELAKLDL